MNDRPHRRLLLQWGAAPVAALAAGLPHVAMGARSQAASAVEDAPRSAPRRLGSEYAQLGASAAASGPADAQAAVGPPLIDLAFGAAGDGGRSVPGRA